MKEFTLKFSIFTQDDRRAAGFWEAAFRTAQMQKTPRPPARRRIGRKRQPGHVTKI